MSTLQRGFKSWSEQIAAGIRRDLGIAAHDPLPPDELAKYLDVRLWTPDDIPNLPSALRSQLFEQDPSGWSAVTQTIGTRVTVIYNPTHSSGRIASNIAHELAHILLDHRPSTIILSPDGAIVMRTFNAREEEEASWLSGSLLLPRVALLHAIRDGLAPPQIAERFGVSGVLVSFRIRITGVKTQTVRVAGSARRHE